MTIKSALIFATTAAIALDEFRPAAGSGGARRRLRRSRSRMPAPMNSARSASGAAVA